MSTDCSASLPLARVVAALDEVAATRARSVKTASLAALLDECPKADLPALVGLVLGRPRQGRIGIGFRGLLAAREAVSPAASSSLSVRDVDAALQRFAELSGPGSAGARRAVLSELFSRADAAEQDLLLRSLGGEVRTGALEGVLTDAAAAAAGLPGPEVRRAAMLSGSLAQTVVLALHDPEAIARIGLQIGTAITPMLASPGTSAEDAVGTLGIASVEHKLDGARIQVHRDGDHVRVFTRSLADVTARVPEIVEIVRTLGCRQAVLDGETLMLDDDGTPRPFQETMSRFGSEAPRDQVLAPRFFDLLHLDGEDLLDEPLRRRRELLLELAPDHVIAGEVTDDPATARGVLEQALAQGHEGVLVKAIDSPYAAGRRGSSWLKVKPVHTYDLVVLGAEWGSGRREGWLSNLHLGARDPDGRYGEPGGFVMVGKTFKGLTDELLRWQTETFPRHEVRRTRGAVLLRPEIVVEIAIDGVQASPRYPGGIALRFARVKHYRPDKPAEQADTITALQSLLRS